jgi:hypothetical protein
LGSVVITRNCLDWFNEKGTEPLPYYRRHVSGDWGDLGDDDKQLNDQALIDNGRLLSAYVVAGQKLYVITEHDRSVTTMMLAEEY